MRTLECPYCKTEIHTIGIDTYPEDGISAECGNKDCKFKLKITLPSSTPGGLSFLVHRVCEFTLNQI